MIEELKTALEVNSQLHVVEVGLDTPLLVVLRNYLKINSPKYGCGEEQCGSCMVLLNGVPTPSCCITVSEVGNKAIMTLEGIDSANGIHPIQKSMIDRRAVQCGYCLSGIIMSAVALVLKVPKPTRDQVKLALDRHICRCGSHNQIIEAVMDSISSNK